MAFFCTSLANLSNTPAPAFMLHGMDQQVRQKYFALTPVILWPWLWLQFWALDRYLARRGATQALIGFDTRRCRIFVRYVSDHRKTYRYIAPDLPAWERPAVRLAMGEAMAAFSRALEPAMGRVSAAVETAPRRTARDPPTSSVSPGLTRGLHLRETPDQVRRYG